MTSRTFVAKQIRRPQLTAQMFDLQLPHPKSLQVIRYEWVCVFDEGTYGRMDIAKAVIFHISAVNFTWTRGDKAPVAAGHDYSLFDPAVIATVHVITDGKKPHLKLRKSHPSSTVT